MDLLVLSFDGASKAIIDAMPMPFTHSLFSRSHTRLLQEDLISRGWAEILTGEHASENRAFYQMPMADKSYDFSASYSKTDMVTIAKNEPLWRAINRSGKSVGFMNVPTTGPADNVDGFLVAGGGGGLQVGAGIPDNMVYPPAYLSLLRNRNYAQDIRLPGGATTVSGFIERIREAEITQADTFIELARAETPNLGFFCFRMTTEIQYLARYEIQRCAEGLQKASEAGEQYQPESEVQEKLLKYYESLDNQIRKIFESLSPRDFIFTGDHSTVTFEYEANVDVWLEEMGYLKRMSPIERKARHAILRARRKLHSFTPKGLRTTRPNRVRRPVTPFSPSRSKAFGTFYETGNFAGIYINDRVRFGGPITSDEQQEKLVDEICSRLNETTTANEYGLNARPFRRKYTGTQYGDLMPDIEISKPDEIYFSGRHWNFIRRNPALVPQSDSLAGVRYPNTGVKGRDPLFVFSNQMLNHMQPNDPNDLRVVYRMICRYFEKAS